MSHTFSSASLPAHLEEERSILNTQLMQTQIDNCVDIDKCVYAMCNRIDHLGGGGVYVVCNEAGDLVKVCFLLYAITLMIW